MKKLFLRLLVFLFSMLIFYSSFIFLVGNYGKQALKKNIIYKRGGYGHTYSRLSDADKLKDIDVMIIGSSHAYRGMDTRIFKENGIKVFNLGTSSQTPLQTEVLVKYYMERLQPELIIFETNPGSFASDGVESSLDILANLPEINKEAFYMAFEINNVKTYNTLIFSFLNEIILKQTPINEPVNLGFDTYVKGGGFVERDMAFYKKDHLPMRDLHFKNYQVEAFERIIDFFIQNDINYFLVKTPVTVDHQRSIRNNKEIDSFFLSYGKFKNYNKTLLLKDDLHFYDSNHLNQFGVELFTKEVIKDISQYF